MIKVVFLVSGGGGTLRFFYFAVKTLGLPFNLVGIISDRECDALKYGRAIGVASYVIPYSKNDDTALNDVLSEINPDCVVTNFHKVLSSNTLECCSAHFINLHYSILPAYTGYIGMKKIIKEARIQRVRFLGATCHEVSDQLDAGDILCQTVVATDWDKPDEWIENRIFRSACLIFLNVLCMKFLHKTSKCSSMFCCANPALVFSDDFADEAFWMNVSKCDF